MIQRSERFTKAYDSLVDAFFKGVLAAGTCMACACGNIVAAAAGISMTKEEFLEELERQRNDEGASPKAVEIMGLWSERRHFWGSDAIYASMNWEGVLNVAGYTTEEFVEIEKAFEQATHIWGLQYHKHSEQEILEDQYKGLCAVVDVLLQLEGEETGGDELKAKFREHPKLVVV